MRTLTKATLATLLAVTAAGAFALPPGSFIRKPVRTVEQLVAHASKDPVVMDRYERHFRKDRGELLAYFRTLHLAKLNRTGVYTVFNVHDGILRSKPRTLKAGKLVFADANGRAVLLVECGNPMVWELPKLGTRVDVSTSAVERDFVGATEPVIAHNVVEPGVSPVLEAAMPQAPIAPAPQMGSITGRDNFLPLLALGAIPFFIKSGGNDDPPPVPEPATITAIVVGAAGFVARKRRK